MVGHLVLKAPQPPVRRREDEDPAPRFQHPAKLSQRRHVVIEMLEHVEGGDHVERLGLERQLENVGAPDVVQPSLAAELERLLGDVHPLHLAQRLHLLHQQTCSAARIQDVEVVALGVALPHPIEHDAAPRGVPPVALFDPVEDLVCV